MKHEHRTSNIKHEKRSLSRQRILFAGMWLFLCALTLWPTLTTAQTPISPNDALVIAAGTTHSGDLATIGQPIVVDGVVEGDVTSVSGSITVRGAVEGDVISLFGDVMFEPQAVAEGNVMAATGTVSLPAGAAIASNSSVFNGNLNGRGAASILPGKGGQPLGFAGRFVLALALGLIAVVVATLLSVIWPRSITSGARVVQLAGSRTLALGLIWLLLTVTVVGLLTVALVFSLLGLAIVPVLLLVAHLPYLVGLAVIGQAVGERFGQRGAQAVVSGCAVVVVPCVMLALLSWPAAFGLFYVLAGVGIGSMFLLRAVVVQRNSVHY